MESNLKSVTPKGDIKQKDNLKVFKLYLKKDLYKVTISNNGEAITFNAMKTNKMDDIFYESTYKFEELVKLEKSLRAYDTISEVFGAMVDFFDQKQVIVKEVTQNTINFEIKTTTITKKEISIIITLTKKDIDKDCVIKQLCQKINTLEEDNKSLKDRINNLENEVSEIRDWKNEKDKELEKIAQEKKTKIALKDVDSKIFKSVKEIEFCEQRIRKINKYLADKKFKLKLLFRATRDGDSASTFHSKCDYIRDTLTLVKTSRGFRFGGFTTETWDGNSTYKNDKSAFCFSLDFKKIYNFKGDKAIGAFPDEGPNFGYFMFEIYDNCFKNGADFNDELNRNYDNQNIENEINGGETYAQIVDYEVFQVLFD